MTPNQINAFYSASGMHPAHLSFDIRLFVGGILVLCSLFVLVGLIHLLDSSSPWDKTIFGMSITGLSFIIMMVFIYIA